MLSSAAVPPRTRGPLRPRSCRHGARETGSAASAVESHERVLRRSTLFILGPAAGPWGRGHCHRPPAPTRPGGPCTSGAHPRACPSTTGMRGATCSTQPPGEGHIPPSQGSGSHHGRCGSLGTWLLPPDRALSLGSASDLGVLWASVAPGRSQLRTQDSHTLSSHSPPPLLISHFLTQINNQVLPTGVYQQAPGSQVAPSHQMWIQAAERPRPQGLCAG